jgi:hypothetical protein
MRGSPWASAGAKHLKDAGGTVNSHAMDCMTALHSAAEHGWDQTVKVLVADGTDLQPKDLFGMTPFDRAAGKHPRAFLEPEHVKHEEPMALLKGYIVAATGQPRSSLPGA